MTKLLLLVLFFVYGCATAPDPRIIGTIVSDKDTTMAYLQSSGKFTEEQLKLFSGLLGKLKVECDGVTEVLTLEDYRGEKPLGRIIARTNEYMVIEDDFLGTPIRHKLIFAEDDYWLVGGLAGPDYREKLVRLVQPAGERK